MTTEDKEKMEETGAATNAGLPGQGGSSAPIKKHAPPADVSSAGGAHKPEISLKETLEKSPPLSSAVPIARTAPAEIVPAPATSATTNMGEQSKPPSPSPVYEEKMKEDIQHILEGTRLPERRGPSAQKKEPELTPQPIQAVHTTPETALKEKQKRVEKHTVGLTENMVSRLSEGVRIITPDGMSSPPLSKRSVEKKEGPKEDSETKRPPLSSLRTLKDDLRELVSVKKMSLVHAATLESDRKKKSAAAGSAATVSHKRRAKRLLRFFITTAILFVLGGAALFVILTVQSERSGARTPEISTSLIFAEQTLTYPLKATLAPREIKQQLSASRYQANLSLGAIERIVPTMIAIDESGREYERPAQTREFLEAIAPTMPDALIRALHNDFFFGVHTEGENVPLLILPVAYYENAFSGMLAWEMTINEHLSPLFTRVLYAAPDESGTPIIVRFEDASIRNYDVRAIKNTKGEVTMLYAFPSRDILIIAESPQSFVEALARLRAERRL